VAGWVADRFPRTDAGNRKCTGGGEGEGDHLLAAEGLDAGSFILGGVDVATEATL